MKFNIEMDEKEVKKYFKKEEKSFINFKNKINLKDKKQQGLFIIIGTGIIGSIFIALIINSFSPPPPPTDYSHLLNMSWGQLLKLGGIIAFPFIIISWIIHGVQIKMFA